MRSLLSPRPPAIVFLNSHFTSTLVGSFSGFLDDAIAKQVGVGFHQELLKGTQVAKALHRALLGADATGKAPNRSHRCYAMSGYGDIVLPRTKSARQSTRKKPAEST